MNNQHHPDLDKIKNLLEKVQALAERGIEGEREAAKGKLKILLEKYNITLREITKNKKTKRTFSLKNTTDCASIFFHVVMDVEPKANLRILASSRQMFVWLTPQQFIEVTEKYRYFWKLYEKQKELFLHAFLIKNNIGLAPNSNCRDSMSEVDADELMRLSSAISKGNFMPDSRLIEANGN